MKNHCLHIATAAVVATLFAASVQAQTVDCSINWNTTVATAQNTAYGLNLYNGYDPDIAGQTGSAAYKTNVKFMNPGIVRYHRMGKDGQMSDSTLKSSGWVIDPDTNPRWDRAKIQAALRGSFTFYPVKLMNIVNWPEGWQRSSTDKRLNPNRINDYALFCQDLVRIINIEMGADYAIDEWEVLNEPDAIYSGATGAGEVADIYIAVSNKMRELRASGGGYPTKSGRPLKIGGPAFANTFTNNFTLSINTFVDTFAQQTRNRLDFVSYHQYSSGGPQDSTEHFKRARDMGNATRSIRKSFVTRWPSSTTPKFYHDEFNLYYAANFDLAPAQGKITGAIFDAISMAAMVKDGADATMAWNEADGWYGKLNNDVNYTKRAGAYVYNLYNAHLRGSVKKAASASEATFYVYPVNSSGKKNFALINQSGASQTVKMTFSGSTPTGYTAYRITDSAPNPGAGFAVPSSSLTRTAGLSIPGNSITVFVQSGTSTFTPNATTQSAPSALTAPATTDGGSSNTS